MEVEHISFFSRIKSALIGVFIGLALFFGSFVVLYINEGLQKFSEVIETSTEIQQTKTDVDGTVVYTNVIKAKEPIKGDTQFISGGNFLNLMRHVEVYAWREIEETSTDTNVGGSQTRTTTYTYEKDWTSTPQRTSQFNEPEGHKNPTKTIEDASFFAGRVQLGDYPISDIESVALHNAKQLNLKDIVLIKGEINNGYVYIYKDETGTIDNPVLGDQRISYTALELDKEMTFVGALKNNAFTKHNEPRAFDLFVGDRDDALETAKKEDSFRIWGLRLLGFAMMMIGIFLIVNPFIVFLDIIPIFGALSRFVVLLLSLLISLVMSVLTILISNIFHSVVALFISIILTIVVVVYLFRRKKTKDTTHTKH